MLGYSAERPFPSHCVLFSLERPNRMQQKINPGKTPPHWLSLMLDYLQLPINHFFPHHPQITNPMALQQLINKTPRLTGFLVAGAYVRISVSFSPACQTGAAARRARLKKSNLWLLEISSSPRWHRFFRVTVKVWKARNLQKSISQFPGKFLHLYTPPKKLTWQWKTLPFEDVFPIQDLSC